MSAIPNTKGRRDDWAVWKNKSKKKKQTALFSSVQAEEHYKETSGYSANEVEHWIKAGDFVK